MRIRDRILMWLEYKYEDYTHYVFNKRPHYARCWICDEVLSSKNGDTPSPEERCWRRIAGGGWICYRCDCRRDFMPYIKLIDLDEKISRNLDNPDIMLDSLKKRKQVYEKTTKDLCKEIIRLAN